jgi:hypothetical protein
VGEGGGVGGGVNASVWGFGSSNMMGESLCFVGFFMDFSSDIWFE